MIEGAKIDPLLSRAHHFAGGYPGSHLIFDDNAQQHPSAA
jgi:hypothetical protein